MTGAKIYDPISVCNCFNKRQALFQVNSLGFSFLTFAVLLNPPERLSLAALTVTNRNLSGANSSGMNPSKHS